MKEEKSKIAIILVIPAVIAGGAALGGAALTAASQGNINRRTRNFQREMFDKTNLYNSPLEQRKRLEAAGLNPNLIYGSSPSGAAGEAKQPAQPDEKAVDFTTAGQQVGGALAQIYDIKSAQANIDVNQARTENLKADTVNKGIEAVNSSLRAGAGSIDLRTKNALYQNTIATAEERLRNLAVNTGYTENKDAREQMITNETLQKIRQETSNLKTQGRVLNQEAIMRTIDNELYSKYKIRPQDPIYYRIIGDILQKLGISETFQGAKNEFNQLFKP